MRLFIKCSCSLLMCSYLISSDHGCWLERLPLFQKREALLSPFYVYRSPFAETYILVKSGGLHQSALRRPYLGRHENISPSSSCFEASPFRSSLPGEILQTTRYFVRVQKPHLSATFNVGRFWLLVVLQTGRGEKEKRKQQRQERRPGQIPVWL